MIRLLAPATARQPDALGHLLQAIDFLLDPDGELAVTTPDGGSVQGAAKPMTPWAQAWSSGRNSSLAAGPEG